MENDDAKLCRREPNMAATMFTGTRRIQAASVDTKRTLPPPKFAVALLVKIMEVKVQNTNYKQQLVLGKKQIYIEKLPINRPSGRYIYCNTCNTTLLILHTRSH